MKKIIFLTGILILIGTILHTEPLDKLTERLLKVYHENLECSEQLPVYVVMQQQYDTGSLLKKAQSLDKETRREYTVRTLREHSEKTQYNIKLFLSELEKSGNISRLRHLWIANVIGMNADRKAIIELSQHPDVKIIDYDPHIDMLNNWIPGEEFLNSNHKTDEDENIMDKSRRRERRKDNPYFIDRRAQSPKFRRISDSVELINAPYVWDLGYEGEGVVIAVLDTGVNYYHNDLRNNMWEHPDFPNHGYNFVDDDYDTMDRHGHGTYCSGIAAGTGLSGIKTGVAPASKIMSLKVLDDDGRGQSQGVWEAMQFAVEYGADIMSVSLGWIGAPEEFRKVYRDISVNILAAGVIASKSAGNTGHAQDELPVPYNISVPSDCPPPYLPPDQTLRGGISAIMSIGATDINDNIAHFSARGPATWEGVDGYDDYPYNPEMGLIKPDICAPGVDVVSLLHSRFMGYRIAGGTSASAPSIAGVIALMLSKNRFLTPEDIARILQETAVPLSESKNNVFGAGRVDAKKAVKQSPPIIIEHILFRGTAGTVPQYGDTVEITITLRNLGFTQIPDVTGTISTDSQYIEILDDTAHFGSINAGSQVELNNAFTVKTAKNIPNNYKAEFNMLISSGEEINWNASFTMDIAVPKLDLEAISVFDPYPGGNNNGMIDAGENLKLHLLIRNSGDSDSPPVSFNTVSESEYAVIRSISAVNFPGVRSGESLAANISLAICEQAATAEVLSFAYTIESGDYKREDRFYVVVGGTQIGRGERISNQQTPSPIDQYFRSLRSQTAYTAEELRNFGAQRTYPITHLGYYVVSAPGYALPDFKVRMKQTENPDAAEHDGGPYDIVYQTDFYTPSADNWDLIKLNTPFSWNGIDNILIDTAFSPSEDWSASGQVKMYDYDNGFRYIRADNPDQSDNITKHTVDMKPQVVILFDTGAVSEGSIPENLTAEIVDEYVYLSWQKANIGDNDSRCYYLHGFNIYSNGFRLNDKLVEKTEYIDKHHDSSISNCYFVTAVYEDGETVPSNTAKINPKVATPVFSYEPGNYEQEIHLSITTSTPDAAIHYTTDGTIPNETSPLFYPDEPLLINETTTVKAYAVKEGLIPSDIAIGTFNFVSVEEDYYAAYKTELLSAYPNPFNPATVIEFTLRKKDHVTIEIFNIAGQKVRTLINSKLDMGKHSILWEGENDQGRRLSSGVYFYRMSASGYRKTKKTLMVK